MSTIFKDEKGNTVGKRVDMFRFKTHELRIRVSNCGRHQQRSKEDYALLRASILRDGQNDPVIIQKDGQIPFIVDGMGRYEVFCDLNKHEWKDAPREIIAVYKEGNPIDAIWRAIHQNKIRSGVVPLDDAYNIQALKNQNLTDEEIAEGYFPGCMADKTERRKALNWVTKRTSLLGLAKEVQQALTDGEIKVTAAEHLSRLQAEQQREAVKHGKVTSKDIAKATGKESKITMKEIRQELDDIISEFATEMPDKVNDRMCKLRDKISTKRG